MAANHVAKYKEMNTQLTCLRQITKDHIWRMWELWELMDAAEQDGFCNREAEIECFCDVPPTEK